MDTLTERPASCLSRMLDVRGYVLAARAAMARAEPGAALAVMLVFGVIALVLIPIWVVFDLQSTWEFTTGLRAATEPTIYELGARADNLLGLSVGAALVGLVFTGFTLLPSLFEIGFPAVNHPLLNTILLVSVVFDYTTDWGAAADLVARWETGPLLGFVYTALVCMFVSVGVQALLACCLTVIVFGALAIIRGGPRARRATIIEQ